MWNNALFTQDSEKILGDKVEFIELGHEQVGYYDGAHSIASAARPYRKMPTTTWLSFIWAYGSSVWKAAGLAQDGTNLREAMLKAAPAADVRAILQALGVLQPAQQWAGATVAERGISARYAAEILDPQVRRAHGQQGLQDTTGLAAMLAAAQEDGANAYAAAGGDNMLERLQRVVRKTGAGVRTARRVVGLRHQQFDKEHAAWLVRHEPTHNNGRRGGQDASVEAFDKVILAAFDLEIQPESSDGRTYNLTAMYEPDMNAGSVSKGDDRAFSSVHVTFFTSDAKLSPWGGNDQALFLDAGNVEGMQEVALVREIISLHDGSLKTEYLYRVLSQSPVIQELHKYANITWSYHTKIENAYPILVPQSTFPLFKAPFVEGLWWTTLIQHAGSTVDLNWLAGKAVAEDLIKGVTQK
ncbi:hypothetical protein F5Y19DRAFT_383354 [Xylariaceae sp. FL1651]|nr:hypothetical protein F5Y19DRAFT_383354 [Xylariaceae sp. FL1651]